MKYLGIDFGESYIGLAIADERKLAVPVKVVPFDSAFWKFVQNFVAKEGVAEIVIGWPISMAGGENHRTKRTEGFIEELEEHIALPIHREDERLSSAVSQRKGVKGRDDAAAAAEILQTYLDRNVASATA